MREAWQGSTEREDREDVMRGIGPTVWSPNYPPNRRGRWEEWKDYGPLFDTSKLWVQVLLQL